ncbi:MAG: hypothetical protein KF906_03575 [Actinobacteria bacterium]|nr:hypothetical protein [Actinomycetota bacterium]
MSLSKRQRDKARTKAGELLGVPVATIVPARSGVHPLGSAAIAAGGAIAVAVATAVIFGTVMFPGVVVIIVAVHAMSPHRMIAVCDQGFALLKRSGFNGRPSAVVGLFGFDQLVPGAVTSSHARYHLGPEELWIPKAELANLSPAVGPAGPSVPGFVGG